MRGFCHISLCVIAFLAAGLTAIGAEDILIADFEDGDYGNWTVEGDAFGTGPATGRIGNQQAVSGFLGKGLVNTFFKGDGTTGTLTSPAFSIERDHINFLVGGGQHEGQTCINLLVDGKVARSTTGPNNELLRWSGWPVLSLRGRMAQIQIVDRETGGWGHINVDHIVQTNRSAWAAAVAATREALQTETDPRREERRHWENLKRQFPEQCAALERDLGNRAAKWLAQTGEASELRDLAVRHVKEAGRFGGVLQRRLDAMKDVPADDPAWLDIYSAAAQLRASTQVARDIAAMVRSTGDKALEAEFDALWDEGVPLTDGRWDDLRRRSVYGRLVEFGVEDIVFAARKVDGDGHWYANFGTWSNNPKRTLYHEGGRLSRLNLKAGKVTHLVDDPKGGVRDPQMHYEGRKILFSYRKGGQPYYHLHEINIDGTGLRQLTDGPFDDIEPVYLPDGGIAFCSSRCNRMVQCYFVRVAVIHRCDADGSNIRQLSANLEQDNTPWLLPDGRILHQRWEYIDRSQVQFHHLWTMNPDGTNQMVYYGNMTRGNVYIDAKPIPNSDKVVFLWSPGHGRKEHAGHVTILDPTSGPDRVESARRITKEAHWRDPIALSEDCFLVAGDTEIRLMNGQGEHAVLYDLPPEDKKAGLKMHEPRPILPRPRERIIVDRSNRKEAMGTLVLEDIHIGRNMGGVEPGEIKKLLILEALPKPVNFSGGQEPLTHGGSFTMERILGTVPVAEDGSAFFEIPPLRSLFFVALDENDMSVKRMQSFLAVQPGEKMSCVGCHEQRTQTPRSGRPLQAMLHPPSQIEPIIDVPDVFDFPRDIQPILDKHCVACHDYQKTDQGGPRAGKVILTGDRGPLYSHSYMTLTNRRLFSDGRNGGGNRAPRTIGSSASRVLRMVDGQHYKVQFTAHEKKMLRLWIDTAATYPGTYAALGSGMVGDACQDDESKQVIETRCSPCHAKRQRFDRHLAYNLTRPEKSSMLLAPLAPEAGGWGMTRKTKKDGKEVEETIVVFKDTSDPGYQALLKSIQNTKQQLDRIKRFDMPDFRPNQHYIREMKFYGVLVHDYDVKDPIDVYAVDQAYWKSLWHRPESQ
jgi:hypothetical protein